LIWKIESKKQLQALIPTKVFNGLELQLTILDMIVKTSLDMYSSHDRVPFCQKVFYNKEDIPQGQSFNIPIIDVNYY